MCIFEKGLIALLIDLYKFDVINNFPTPDSPNASFCVPSFICEIKK